MRTIAKRTNSPARSLVFRCVAAIVACALTLVATLACVAGAGSTSAFAAEGRATFATGTTVRSTWINLAGGKDNVTAIRQYHGSEPPEGVTTRTVSAANSELPIYSWFDDGTIYYWSEDPNPFTAPDASYMFYSFDMATVIEVAPFDTSRTTDMEAMFGDCGSVERLDVAGFDTTNVRCMYCMFIYCSSLKELDLSHFNTTNTTAMSDSNYGSLCGMFIGCSSLEELDLSSFDMTRTSWPYHTQNMFPGCTSLRKLTLGPNNRFNGYTSLSGSWTQENTGLTLGGGSLMGQYNASNAFSYSGTWIRNLPEGHYYRTDGSLGETNLWEVHTPDDRFKGYCLNLNKFGVGEELDRILVESDADVEALLCTEAEGSVHGYAPLGSSMREALITLIYYGWPNDAADIQERYGLSDQQYLDITQNAIWDFTDRYDSPAGPGHYEGNELAAYNELVAQRYANIEGDYLLFLYRSWDPSRQNLLSIMGVDDQEYGGVSVRKQSENGSENLAGAVFTVYDEAGNEVGTMTSSANGVAYICRTDHTAGLPLGNYTVRETTPPAGYLPSDVEYHFTISEANEIVTEGWRVDPSSGGSVPEEMIFYDRRDEEYSGGGVGVVKRSDTGKMLVGAEFTVMDAEGEVVAVLVTNDSGVAATGKRDLPLGSYTIVETKAPEGHMPSSESRSFEITEDNQFLTFTFEDSEKHGSITLACTKILEAEGQELEAGMFTFELLDDHYEVIQTATNDAEGNVVFDAIEYGPDDLGYANYHIVEVIGDEPGVRYDRHREDVTVTIYDDGSSTLNCSAVYDADGAVFTNALDAVKHEVSFSKQVLNTGEPVEGAVLELRDVAGRRIDSWTSAGEPHVVALDPGTYTLRELSAPSGYFEVSDIRFELSEEGVLSVKSGTATVDGLQLAIGDRPVSSTELELLKVDGATGEALEGAEFTLEGTGESTYRSVVTTDGEGHATFEGIASGTYTLTESACPAGYSSDAGPWTVEVTYDRAISKTANVNASGVASGTYSTEVFTDTVTIPGNPESIHVELRYQTEDGWDYLELLDAEGNVITQDKDGNPIGDTRAGVEGHLWGGMESGQINTLSFDLAGDTVSFHFVPDENTAAYGYYAVVTAESQVSVTDASGAVVEPADGVYTFENNRTEAQSTSVQFAGTKTIEGRDLAESEFTFELSGADGVIATASNAADGSFAFPEIEYTEEGSYTYEVREVPGNAEDVIYDSTVYEITVDVALAEDGSQLVATIGGDSTTGDDLTFANIYTGGGSDGSAVAVQLAGSKVLEGRDLAEGEFSFHVSGPDGVAETVTNAADGTFAFSEIVLFEEGTYTYEVSEVEGDLEDVTYDATIYSVVVTVTQGDDGQLVATIGGDSTSGTDLVFTNIYEEDTHEGGGDDGDAPDDKPDDGGKQDDGQDGGGRRGGRIVPRTGDAALLAESAPFLMAAGAGLAAAGVFARRRRS